MTTLADMLSGVTTPPASSAPRGAFTIDAPAPDLQLPLYDFQCEALEFIVQRRRAYIAYDMGLGKTPIGIATAARIAANGGKTLIVVPSSLRTNWKREITKFAPHLTVEVLVGKTPHALSDVDVYVIGEAVLQYWHVPLVGHVQAVIADEAHFYKNKNAKRTKALQAISASVDGVVVLMSGTPIPNGRHEELAPQIEVLGSEAWAGIGGKGKFWNTYCPPDPSGYGRQSCDNVGLNKAMTASFMLRRRRDEVIELPNKGRSVISIESDAGSARTYRRMEADFIAWLAENDGNVAGAMRAEALMKMNALRKQSGTCKIKGTVDHVKNILDNDTTGVFIVAEHRDVMTQLYLALQSYNPVSVAGGMSDAEKQHAIDSFTSGQSRVLIGQIKAAGTGLTLHGGGLNRRVVVAQLPWSPSDLVQAEDRLHRIGQTADVEVEIALSHIENEWTIDERLWSQLEIKAFSSASTVDGNGQYLIGDDSISGGVLDTYR
jgi:SWI/SNF-related matrix-associated actin-dependent regulator 1 of chromatin subfamily A